MAKYKIYGTNEPYDGKVVEVAGFLYTTVGGALEGFSYQLAPTNDTTAKLNNTLPLSNPSNNPVTGTFVSRMVYYRANGNGVPVGTTLHQHQDGTIMVGNSADPSYDMNNPNNVVTTTNPNPPIGSGIGGSGNTTPGGPRDNQMNQGGSSY